MITKQSRFAGRDMNGEHIHVLQAGYDNEGLTKLASVVASPPQLGVVQRFMKDLPRQNGKLYTLISALGAGEYWGSNSNADYFGEEPLLHVPPGWDQMPYNQQVLVGKKWAWGYPTFYNARAFAHHQNKDPNRAFGSIEYVMWDPSMKRVLLIVAFDRARAVQFGSSGVLDRVENGEYPSVSMGCRVPYDLCSYCADWSRITLNPRVDIANHKKRPIRGLSTATEDYCYHLKNELNKVYPDGRKVMMMNMHPRFFDLSVVFIGADKTSYVLAKLADQRTDSVSSAHVVERRVHSKAAGKEKVAFGSGIEDLDWEDPKAEEEINNYLKRKRMEVGRIKTSALSKDAEIFKQVQSNFRRNLPRLQREEPPIPRVLQDLLSARMADGLSTAGSMGVVAKPREFQRIFIRAIGRPGLADELDDKRLMFRTGAAPTPDFRLSGSVVPKILKALLPIMEMRSALTPSIAKRTIIVVKTRPEPDLEDESGCAHPDHPLMDKISSAYSAYRRDLLYKSPELIKQAVFAHPEVYQALYGDSILEEGLVKSGADVMESVVGMLTSTYLNEAYLDTPVSEFVESNCNLAGLEKAAGLAVLGGVA